MALLLYRLGRFTARHAWSTLAAWLLLLVGLGGAMATVATPPTSAISIPGAKFQSVLSTLGREIPAAAGGIGTITIENESGAITPAQRVAIERTLADWEKAPHVQSVMNPFETQQTLDDSRAKVEDGKEELETQDYKLQQGHWLYDEGQRDLAAARAELASLEKAGQGSS